PLTAENGRLALPLAPSVPEPRGVARAVNPIVEIPEQAVRGVFLICARATLRVGLGRVVIGHWSFPVAFAVAVSVLTEPEYWRFGHKRAAAGQRQCARHHQPVEEHCPFVDPAVAVGV